ncbi:hypothetical protein CR513_18968, partial [Mucuna pruriens]
MLLLQEFDIKVIKKSGVENLVANHLSRIERRIDPLPIIDDFPDEQLMQLDGIFPWFTNIFNYLNAFTLLPKASRSHQDKIKSEYYVWDDPYLWKFYSDQVIRRCIPDHEIQLVGIMDPIRQLERYWIIGFIGPPFSRTTIISLPKALISDQRSHLCNKIMSTLLEKCGVVHRMATTYHLQTNGQVEACHLSIEIEHRAYWAMKGCNLAFDQVGKERKLQLQEHEELRLEAYENSRIYKEKVKHFHDNMILRKEFKVNQKVLLFNSLEIRNEAINKIIKVNGQQLKPFHESPTMMQGDVKDLSLVKPTFLKQQIEEIFQLPLQEISYRIVFGKACHLSVEIEHRAYWAMKGCNLAFDQAGKERKLQLQELEEFRLEAFENSKIYKEKVKHFHDNMIFRKEFKVCQKVLLFNSHFKLIASIFRSKWDGPFVITNVFPYSIVEIRDEASDKIFKVNGHQLKPFHEIPTMMRAIISQRLHKTH